MIRFKCRCSHVLEVEDDQAGSSFQCPRCGLLVDVPTLSDMRNLEDDGTFRVEEWEAPAEPGRVGELYRTFTRDHVDPVTGAEIDLRRPVEDVGELPLADPTQIREARSLRPKYDPVTGELIRPLDVEGEGGGGEGIPMAAVVGGTGAHPARGAAGGAGGSVPMAQRAVGYATVHAERVPSLGAIAMELLMPVNAAVMFFTSIAYALGQIATASLVFVFLNLPIAAMLLAHYGNVVEETGPEGKDELPRPLRHLELGADLWWPFARMFGALVICYAPAAAVLVNGLPWQMAVVVGLVGSIFLPAVMLTTVTSGSMLNLRPDRVMGVIGVIGGKYAGLVLLWVAAMGLHVWTWVGVVVLREMMLAGLNRKWGALNHPSVLYPMIAVAIYLMHYFCWYLGVVYRRHHEEFAWVLQRHVRDPNRRVVTVQGVPRRSRRHGVARPR